MAPWKRQPASYSYSFFLLLRLALPGQVRLELPAMQVRSHLFKPILHHSVTWISCALARMKTLASLNKESRPFFLGDKKHLECALCFFP